MGFAGTILRGRCQMSTSNIAHDCPICGLLTDKHVEVRHSQDTGSSPFVTYSCPRCGDFQAGYPDSLEDMGMASLTKEQRRILSGLIRKATDAQGRFPTPIVHTEVGDLVADGPPMQSVTAQMEDFLRVVADFSGAMQGQCTPEHHVEAWAARLFLPPHGKFTDLRWSAHEQGWLKKPKTKQGRRESYCLTFEGWKYVESLEDTPADRPADESGNHAFVAMWFHDDLDPIYDDGIAPALRSIGYEPVCVKKMHHGERIDAKIEELIKDSSLLVAELTGSRGGVYYEAGLARGWEIPVVWCCNKGYTPHLPEEGSFAPDMSASPSCAPTSWTKQVHFDTKHFQILRWTDADDLRRQLIEHIVERDLSPTAARGGRQSVPAEPFPGAPAEASEARMAILDECYDAPAGAQKIWDAHAAGTDFGRYAKAAEWLAAQELLELSGGGATGTFAAKITPAGRDFVESLRR